MSTTFLLGGDLPIHRIGYGAMRLCGQPGNFGPYADGEGGRALLRRAVELGVNFTDTAHPCGPGWNEKLIGEALVAGTFAEYGGHSGNHLGATSGREHEVLIRMISKRESSTASGETRQTSVPGSLHFFFLFFFRSLLGFFGLPSVAGSIP